MPPQPLIARLRAAVVGIGASVLAPFWMSPRRLASLTQPSGEIPLPVPEPPVRRSGGRTSVPAGPRRSSAQRLLKGDGDYSELRLSRRISDRSIAALPRPLWRNSCLYRSIAGCLALRWYGLPATVVVGFRRIGEKAEAHAWVAINGAPFPATGSEQGHPRNCEGAGAFQYLVAAGHYPHS